MLYLIDQGMMSRKKVSIYQVQMSFFPQTFLTCLLVENAEVTETGKPRGDDEGRKSSPHPSGWHVGQRHWENELQSGNFNRRRDQAEMLRNNWGDEFERWEKGEKPWRVEDESGRTSTDLRLIANTQGAIPSSCLADVHPHQPGVQSSPSGKL